MKIAFLLGRFPALSQTFILNQITGLIDRGHQVDIYARTVKPEPRVHSLVHDYGLMGRVICTGQFTPQAPLRKTARVLAALRWLLVRGRQSTPLWRSLNVRGLGREALSLGPFFHTAAFQGKGFESYDVVHAHFGQLGTLGALLKYTGIIRGALLTTFYGYDISGYVQRHGPGVYRLLFDRCDQILCLSERMKRDLIGLNCDPGKIAIHHLGVDLSRFAFAIRKARPGGGVNLFTPARLVEKKGLEYAIRAVEQLVGRHPSIRYRIAGDGRLRSDLEALIAGLNLQAHVELLGWQTQDQIVQHLQEADILVAPSVTAADGDEEGTPTVLIEALSQGLPVVSTWHSGIPEIVQDGESGFLVPERDVRALAERTAYLIEHPELWPRFGSAGRAHMETQFDINKLNDRLARRYQECCDQRAGGVT